MFKETPFIIAEVGSNWRNLQDCMDSIVKAKLAGANAVKFQLFNHDSLYGRPGHMTGEMYVQWLPRLKEKAHACGIEFMCSAFSPALLDIVNEHVSIHKLASCEMTHLRMLERLREYGKPVIVSTGAQSFNDISTAVRTLGNTPMCLMYCAAAYPATELYLETLHKLSEYGHPVGYSDHSTDVRTIPTIAHEIYGAVCIEKHFNAMPADERTPDSGHSLTPEQFKIMCDAIRGDDRIGFPKAEEPFITTHKRRLMAIRDIKKGDQFYEDENFGIYRALTPQLTALSPWVVNEVHGRKAKRDIKQGEGIGPDCIA